MFQPLDTMWRIRRNKANAEVIARRYGIREEIVKIILNRGISTDEDLYKYLYGTIDDMFSPWDFRDMRAAAELLTRKIKEKRPIRIIGDYDADGVTASFILEKGIRRLGGNVDVKIPHRIQDGYGVNPSLIHAAKEDGVDTILTCDNGTKAYDEFVTAKAYGMDVVITDHHKFETADGDILCPPCDALINPHHPDCPYPNKDICGAGIAFKLIQALYEEFGLPFSEAEEFIELAALATMADVMSLQGENRILVKKGLSVLSRTKNPGLRALLKELRLTGKEINSYHVGFRIGPCINAAGRLQSAETALNLLRCRDEAEAEKPAKTLTMLNDERKAMTEQEVKRAAEILDHTEPIEMSSEVSGQSGIPGQLPPGGLDRVVVVYIPDCHESLTGIIAGRLREKYCRPVYVLTNGKTSLKGSGRSISEYNMIQELEKASPLLLKYGGHPGAAGLSLNEDNLDAFRRLLNEKCRLTETDLTPKMRIDVVMPLKQVSLSLIQQLRMLEPFGQGNEKPVFVCRNVHIFSKKVVGSDFKVVRMDVYDDSMKGRYQQTLSAVYFGDEQQFLEDLGQRNSIYAVSYYPRINEYRGTQNIEIVINDYIMDGPESGQPS